MSGGFCFLGSGLLASVTAVAELLLVCLSGGFCFLGSDVSVSVSGLCSDVKTFWSLFSNEKKSGGSCFCGSDVLLSVTVVVELVLGGLPGGSCFLGLVLSVSV